MGPGFISPEVVGITKPELIAHLLQWGRASARRPSDGVVQRDAESGGFVSPEVAEAGTVAVGAADASEPRRDVRAARPA